MGGNAEASAGDVTDVGRSLGGEPPEARARSAGGLYLPPILSSASLALMNLVSEKTVEEAKKCDDTFSRMQLRVREEESSLEVEPSDRRR